MAARSQTMQNGATRDESECDVSSDSSNTAARIAERFGDGSDGATA